MQRNQKQNGKDQRSLQENQRYQANILCKDGVTEDRNSKGLREGKEITKKWQEYTEEFCKKGPNDLENHNIVGTHLELDILECDIKWALGSSTTNKASGGDLFKILKYYAVKVLYSIS